MMMFGQVVSAQVTKGNPELQDGIHFNDLLCGDSIFPEATADIPKGSVPYLCRAKDGGFEMVLRSRDSGISIYRSDDLVNGHAFRRSLFRRRA